MKARRLGFAVALVVLALDQLAKWIATGPMGLTQVGDGHYFLPFFQFTLTHNEGISLGLLNATNPVGRWMLVALTAAIAIGVAAWIGREKNRIDRHRMVNAALASELQRGVHALAIRASAPGEAGPDGD